MNTDPLSDLAMWKTWQDKVKAALPNFCADTIYVEQMSPPVAEFEEEIIRLRLDQHYAEGTAESIGVSNVRMLRDAEFGARVVQTSIGKLTRMYLDSEVENDFIQRHMLDLESKAVLDIGAGYGRLASALTHFCASVYTVDPVPISVELCRQYCARFAPSVCVMGIADYRARFDNLKGDVDLAVNVHSWNECTLKQIGLWLTELWKLRVPYLFTVSHGSRVQPARGKEYRTWDGKDWKQLLLQEYELIAEENIGLGKHPHALWKRRNANVHPLR